MARSRTINARLFVHLYKTLTSEQRLFVLDSVPDDPVLCTKINQLGNSRLRQQDIMLAFFRSLAQKSVK
jgi:hypothetical protein